MGLREDWPTDPPPSLCSAADRRTVERGYAGSHLFGSVREEFAALGADWDNYDALPPNGRALSEAKYFDSVVGDEIDFIPRPMSNGSVAFYYRTPSFLAEIEIDGSGTAVLAVVGTDSTLATAEEFPLKRPEIRDIPRRIKGYERMLAGLREVMKK